MLKNQACLRKVLNSYNKQNLRTMRKMRTVCTTVRSYERVQEVYTTVDSQLSGLYGEKQLSCIRKYYP